MSSEQELEQLRKRRSVIFEKISLDQSTEEEEAEYRVITNKIRLLELEHPQFMLNVDWLI